MVLAPFVVLLCVVASALTATMHGHWQHAWKVDTAAQGGVGASWDSLEVLESL